MISAIVFDYGGVVKINDDKLIDKIVAYLKIARDDWEREYFLVNHLFNVEKKSFAEVLPLIVSKFDNSEEARGYVQRLFEENKDKHRINSGIIEIIKRLKVRNYKIGLLSNNSLELRKSLIADGIHDLFEVIIISSEVGYQKPQPEIFETLFSKLGVKANEVIFIDDTPRSLEGAGSIGYLPVLYKDNETLESDLANILKIKSI